MRSLGRLGMPPGVRRLTRLIGVLMIFCAVRQEVRNGEKRTRVRIRTSLCIGDDQSDMLQARVQSELESKREEKQRLLQRVGVESGYAMDR